MNDTIEYKCPACGNSVVFDTKTQKMRCSYCSATINPEALKHLDMGLEAEKPDSIKWNTNAGKNWDNGEEDGLKIYTCKSCGGTVMASETTGATWCPYCSNPLVIEQSFAGNLKPDLVIPFKLDKNAAIEKLKDHLSGKKFLPKVFKSENHINEIKGIYVPYWLFSADANGAVRYNATKIRYWSSGNYDYTETSHYSVFRSGNLSFENVPVDGSKIMDDTLMESIEPFNLKDAVDFRTAYLSGFFADKYDVSAEECRSRADNRIKSSLESEFRETVSGYASCSIESSSINVSDGFVKYALLPVWIMNTTWKGENYIFAMNGQTGRFVGNLPCDENAYHMTMALWTIIIGVLIFAIINLIIYKF